MTKENCIKLLAAYKMQRDNEKNSSSVREQSKKNYDMMKAHILNSKKFKDHPILKKLEADSDGKTPKR